jgi:hypothetical protein
MIEYTNALTTREWATVTLILACLVGAFIWDKTREPLLQGIVDIRKTLKLKIAIAFILYFITAGLVTIVMWKIGYWNPLLTKETIIIVCIGFLPFFVIESTATDGRVQFSNGIKKIVGFSAIIAVYVNLVSFNFWWELLAQVIFLILWLLDKCYQLDPSLGAGLIKTTKIMRCILGSLFVFFALKTMIENWDNETGGIILAKLGINVWIPFILVIFVSVFSYLIQNFDTFVKAKFIFNRELTRSEKLAFLIGFHFRLSLAYNIVGNWNYLHGRNGFWEMLEGLRRYRRAYKADSEDINLRSV